MTDWHDTRTASPAPRTLAHQTPGSCEDAWRDHMHQRALSVAETQTSTPKMLLCFQHGDGEKNQNAWDDRANEREDASPEPKHLAQTALIAKAEYHRVNDERDAWQKPNEGSCQLPSSVRHDIQVTSFWSAHLLVIFR